MLASCLDKEMSHIVMPQLCHFCNVPLGLRGEHAPFAFTHRLWVHPLSIGHCPLTRVVLWGSHTVDGAWKKHNTPAVLPRSP